jgi:hypothetical protein
MLRLFFLCLLIGSLLCPVAVFSESTYSSGMIDDDLKYEGFEVGNDGFLKGFIINISNKTFKDLKINVWTMDIYDTRIFWRKSLVIGVLAPGEKYAVKEPYNKDANRGMNVKYCFRIANSR